MKDLDAEMVDDMTRREGDVVPEGMSAPKDGAVKVLRTPDMLVGSVIGLNGITVDSLRAVEAFKTTQGWGLFRRPGLLVRGEGVELSRKLMDAQRQKKAVRLVVDGERGSGKSLLLVHAMATAFVKRWVVLNIPEGKVHPPRMIITYTDTSNSTRSDKCRHRVRSCS